MVFSPIRYVLFTAAIAATTSSLAAANDLTPFPVIYDALTYSLEFDVEVINELGSGINELQPALNDFIVIFDEMVADGSLTFDKYFDTARDFYSKANAVHADFSNKARKEIKTRWVSTPFRFLNDLHPAAWDLIHYGIITVGGNQTKDIAKKIEGLEAYMTEKVPTATNDDTEELNDYLDTFYESIAISDFERKVQDILNNMISKGEDQVEDDSDDDSKSTSNSEGSDLGSTTETPSEDGSMDQNKEETKTPKPTTKPTPKPTPKPKPTSKPTPKPKPTVKTTPKPKPAAKPTPKPKSL